jgi:filamentous hemagglutinin
MLGEQGIQVHSKTLWRKDQMRLDVENPNPGKRPGQIHFQQGKDKYLYDPTTDSFSNAPLWVNKLLDDPQFRSALQKGLEKYLGET